MLDRSKCKKMLVSDNGVDWGEKIVIDITDKGCIAVYEAHEDLFCSGNIYSTNTYCFCKPIQEKQKIEKLSQTDNSRDMTSIEFSLYQKQNEIIDALNKLLEKDGGEDE